MDLGLFIARIFMGLPFLAFGAFHFTNRDAMISYVEGKGIPSPNILVPTSGTLNVLAGLGLILGIFPQVAAWYMFAFLIVESFLMHRFWTVQGEAQQQEMTTFLKHIGWAGAILGLVFVNEWGDILRLVG